MVQGLLLVLLAPLIQGTLRWSRGRLRRMAGSPPLQLYHDLYKLLRKSPALPLTGGWFFELVPILIFACYATLAVFTPVFFIPAEGSGAGPDLLVLIAVLGLAHFLLGLAGLASGAPFGGMGSSRAQYLQALAEPILIFSVFVLAMKWQTSDLVRILSTTRAIGLSGLIANPSMLLLMLALAVALLVVNGRLPVGFTGSHLELVMQEDAVLLAYSGPHLALLRWGEAIRLAFFLTLLGNLFFPWTLANSGDAWFRIWILAPLLYLAKVFFLTFALAFWESTQGRLRQRALTGPALTGFVLVILAALLALFERLTV